MFDECKFESLPLSMSHIFPMCKWPIHGVCVGKHLEESPLGRDMVCFDCAEAESNNYEDNKEEEEGDHAEVVTASVGDATYILKSLMVWQPGEKRSYNKNRGYKFMIIPMLMKLFCVAAMVALVNLILCVTQTSWMSSVQI